MGQRFATRRSPDHRENLPCPAPPLNRRTFLRSAGVCIGLPLLDAMLPVGLGAERKAAALRPKRMLLIGRPLGLHAPHFFPEEGGQGLRARPAT